MKILPNKLLQKHITSLNQMAKKGEKNTYRYALLFKSYKNGLLDSSKK
jgi:hypothetical protein